METFRIVPKLFWIILLAMLSACMGPKSNTTPNYGALPEKLPATEGELLFVDSRCVTCHGYQGTGDGFLAEGLNPPPTDWTRPGALQSRSDADLRSVIREGRGAMPAYPRMTTEQTEALIRHIRHLSTPAS